jgi:hypothetical protein
MMRANPHHGTGPKETWAGLLRWLAIMAEPTSEVKPDQAR